MKTSKLAMITASAVNLGVLTVAPFAHADSVLREDYDTQTHVKIVDSPESDTAVLKLINVPSDYNFQTKLKSDGFYKIDGGVVGDNNKLTVFNDKVKQSWSVKASIDNTELTTDSGKKATVTQFKINDQELLGETANQIIHESVSDKTALNNTGNISTKITDEGLSIEFNNENHDLNAGDILNGTIHYQLVNTPKVQ